MKILLNFLKKSFYFSLIIQAFFWINAYYITGKVDQTEKFFNMEHFFFSIKIFLIYFFLYLIFYYLHKVFNNGKSN